MVTIHPRTVLPSPLRKRKRERQLLTPWPTSSSSRHYYTTFAGFLLALGVYYWTSFRIGNYLANPILGRAVHSDVPTLQYPPGIPTGILSQKPPFFFSQLQDHIDTMDPLERCQRYGWTYTPGSRRRRKIFYGALIADEPWELLEIMATETRGLFAGMVFVESNRTQSFAPRPLKRTNHQILLETLFDAPVQVRTFVNENATLLGLERENWQRQEILQGWIEMGMQPDDLGYIADTDEAMTRDLLNALRTCDNMPLVNYSLHKCNPRKGARLYALARIWEGSPDCITHQRSGHHPAVVMGACIEGIAKEGTSAPRENIYTRQPGYGKDCFFDPNVPPPLWNPADFRMILCGRQPQARAPPNDNNDDPFSDPNYSRFTGYHLHNFFADFEAIRNKYQTYGHAQDGTLPKHGKAMPRLQDMHRDLAFLHSCVRNDTEDATPYHPRVQGGFEALPTYFSPLYFQDSDYRRRRQEEMLAKILADDEKVALAQQQIGEQQLRQGKVIKVDLTK